MNKKTYKKRIEQGRLLVKTYKSAMFELGKYAVSMLDEFPNLTIDKLAKDIKVHKGTISNVKNYYIKNKELFGEQSNETTFLLIASAVKKHRVSIKEMTKENLMQLKNTKNKSNINLVKKFESSVNKIIESIKTLDENEINTLKLTVGRLSKILDKKLTLVA